MIMDLHTHTHHSPDAAGDTVLERVAAAKRLGLQYLAITDHVEVNRWYPAAFYGKQETEEFVYDSERVFLGSAAETDAAKQQIDGITLLCGAELGQIPQNIPRSEAVYADKRLDIALGSVHELPDMPDFFFLDYAHIDIPALIAAYFDEVLALAGTDCYDVLAHLTYGLRYMPNRAAYDLTPHLPVIDEIFRTLIAKNKALELNGSLLKSSDDTDPGFSLVKRYHDLGGKLLTLCTDAHENKWLGHRMDELEQMAKDAGFTHLTVFKKHKPELIPLI